MEVMKLIQLRESWFSNDGGQRVDVKFSFDKGWKSFGAIMTLDNASSVSLGVKREMYARIVVPMLKNRPKTLGLSTKERHTLDVMETKFSGSLCWLTRMDELRNEEVRRRVGVRELICDIVDRKFLLTKIVYKS